MRAAFFGRFQPFHNGHMQVIKDIRKEFGEIWIVICGPAKPDERNPFTFDERKEMIARALIGKGIRHTIHMITDVNDDDKWAKEVMKLGKFDAAFSMNPWTIRCLKKAGINVREHEFYCQSENSGTEIRKAILEGRDWKRFVPKEVYDYIRETGAERRF